MSDYRISVWGPEGLNAETPEAHLAEYLEAVLNVAADDLVAWAKLQVSRQATMLYHGIKEGS